MAGNIMVQGTGSSVGKSVIAAGLCRLFKREGLKAVPFKSQNMALNSYVTSEGLEMGRAQVFQAEAAGIEPRVTMNPVLLKPSGEEGSQVIVNGKPRENMTAEKYYNFKPRLKEIIREAYQKLKEEYDVIVIEGAGSPAEINLQENDIVNMGLARMVDAPVLLAGDIDRGGVFAALYGTVKLLPERDRRRIKGLIINKFRGDKKLLEPGLKEMEEMLGIPFLGVLPYLELALDDEDSLSERLSQRSRSRGGLQVKIILLPHISNFTDFNPLEMYEDLNISYIKDPGELAEADLVIIPGSKNTLADRIFLRERGFDRPLQEYAEAGGVLLGICGGFQMLGEELADPQGVESSLREVPGLNLLPIKTCLAGEKKTLQVEGSWQYQDDELFSGLKDISLTGYEIHMGQTVITEDKAVQPLSSRGEDSGDVISLVNQEGNIFGTYWHGLFENKAWTTGFINNLRRSLNLDAVGSPGLSYQELKEREYDKLADLLARELDQELLYSLAGLSRSS